MASSEMMGAVASVRSDGSSPSATLEQHRPNYLGQLYAGHRVNSAMTTSTIRSNDSQLSLADSAEPSSCRSSRPGSTLSRPGSGRYIDIDIFMNSSSWGG